MVGRRAWVALVVLGCGEPEPRPGPTRCYPFEVGEACSVDTCCDGLECWYAASDGETWDCREASCTEAEAGPARDHCVVASTGPDFEVPCLWEGAWQIDAMRCGVLELGAFDSAYRGTTVDFTTPEGGGCEVTVGWHHESGCRATERWRISSEAQSRASDMPIARDGILTCEPEGCVLGDGNTEVICRAGWRIGTRDSTLLEDPLAGTFTLTGPWEPDVMPMCVGEALVATLEPRP